MDIDREEFDKFAINAGKRIAELRNESAKYRVQRNEAREELAKVKAQLAALQAGRVAGAK